MLNSQLLTARNSYPGEGPSQHRQHHFLLYVAWWAWAVSFTSPSVLEAAWPAFLEGSGIDASDPDLSARIHSMQVLHMVELLVVETRLGPDIRHIVANRLKAMLR